MSLATLPSFARLPSNVAITRTRANLTAIDTPLEFTTVLHNHTSQPPRTALLHNRSSQPHCIHLWGIHDPSEPKEKALYRDPTRVKRKYRTGWVSRSKRAAFLDFEEEGSETKAIANETFPKKISIRKRKISIRRWERGSRIDSWERRPSCKRAKEEGRSTIHVVACTTLRLKKKDAFQSPCDGWNPRRSVQIIKDEIRKPTSHLVLGIATSSMHGFVGNLGRRLTSQEEDSSPRQIKKALRMKKRSRSMAITLAMFASMKKNGSHLQNRHA